MPAILTIADWIRDHHLGLCNLHLLNDPELIDTLPAALFAHLLLHWGRSQLLRRLLLNRHAFSELRVVNLVKTRLRHGLTRHLTSFFDNFSVLRLTFLIRFTPFKFLEIHRRFLLFNLCEIRAKVKGVCLHLLQLGALVGCHEVHEVWLLDGRTHKAVMSP